jgi:hypothetical protein
MTSQQHETDLDWAPAAVARDSNVAERWQAALDATGIDSEVRIEDALRAAPGSSVLPGAVGPSQQFVFTVYVPPEHLVEARRVLIDHGWDGRYGERRDVDGPDLRFLILGALIAIGAGALVIVLRELGS